MDFLLANVVPVMVSVCGIAFCVCGLTNPTAFFGAGSRLSSNPKLATALCLAIGIALIAVGIADFVLF